MRVRNKPWAEPLIEAHPEMIITEPAKFKGNWQKRFKKVQPIRIEIGMGKGHFIIEMALKYPEINFIGIEIQRSVAAIALKKALPQTLPNLQLVLADGADLNEYFDNGEIDRVYLNFSDPWPKTRHEKRRLTYKTFLQVYRTILVEHGVIELKTDNQRLFEYSLLSMNNFGIIFDGVYLDLHHSDEALENVETEYEHKFSEKGQRIYKLKGHF
ncbi:tRNA (guanosine(46)-N7)-methyltransferase TrmB [Pediococcus ethanolidurans]|uniref:tRNA (guanine-N(7)-)-methyltransferase n=1 Tax=Pediococcus ethanolidurans TaxID=319653 RepID=A0A0R2K805_9LACO|nr:tRNA (guanosine(46)-N7)-methyltransferase TrmB [Pediococcus ethanolidurans]KRN82365.1 trmB protein [Pediococcus ethanolidurans]GEN94346.1 tRNA (guanine-N(7)-)-methyltransferase [Pediococcus ethanolidurans]SER58523.1 tRNA (guanine-N(7)-)-methyltransferase [Pediococcus ethanolidurans]